MKDICIIGGGASGTAAAIAAARSGASVVIAEGNARVGKKLLTTGNGRCNLTHVSPSADAYRGDAEFIADVLGELGATGAFTFFKSLGLLLHSDGEGRVYPYSNSANTVLDALRRELDRLGVETVCGFRVKKRDRTRRGFFRPFGRR
ncbi:MAG: NAD(P)/FAD-dependent oxidoreductase [Clostridia bacterium]|nr:NAD(P)/FAD-dependent oxidoreductase [Clostridia bacterium]